MHIAGRGRVSQAHVAVEEQTSYEVWGDVVKDVVVQACHRKAEQREYWKGEQKRIQAAAQYVPRPAMLIFRLLRSGGLDDFEHQFEHVSSKLRREMHEAPHCDIID
jgi:hypothetical protein